MIFYYFFSLSILAKVVTYKKLIELLDISRYSHEKVNIFMIFLNI